MFSLFGARKNDTGKYNLLNLILFVAPVFILNFGKIDLQTAFFDDKTPQPLKFLGQATIGNNIIKLQVADNPLAFSQGLTKRKSITANEGVLYTQLPIPRQAHSMRDMLFSSDLIFLKGNKAVAVFSMLPPCASSIPKCPIYKPTGDYDSVIEIKGGMAANLGIFQGSEVKIAQLRTRPDGTTQLIQ